jgi:predicted patatin/cPLA2 family phospholipase
MRSLLFSLGLVAVSADGPVVKALFKDDKCRVLGLRGGGTNGAYEIGVLEAMVDLLDPNEIAYDVVEGISIGSINAGILSTFEKG